MKKLLTATTALALVGGAAFAEITISGDAKLGLDYNSEPGMNESKHSFKHEMGVDFSGSGTTDGGLSFGGSAGFDTGDKETNTGTVFVSGAFGTITFGGNDAADLLAGGIADVGLNGVGVDDVVEGIRGGSKAQFRYDQTVGNISLALSAGTTTGNPGSANTIMGTDTETKAGEFEVKKNSYAIGMSFNAGGATVGIGYDSMKAMSVGVGYSTGQIAANAFYAKKDRDYKHLGSDAIDNSPEATDHTADGMFAAGYSGLGMDISYTMGASKLTLAYAKTDVSNINPVWDSSTNAVSYGSASFKGMGLGFSHDLGGGASLVAGFAQVPAKAVGDLGVADIGQRVTNASGTATAGTTENRAMFDKVNKASIGLSFSF